MSEQNELTFDQVNASGPVIVYKIFTAFFFFYYWQLLKSYLDCSLEYFTHHTKKTQLKKM